MCTDDVPLVMDFVSASAVGRFHSCFWLCFVVKKIARCNALLPLGLPCVPGEPAWLDCPMRRAEAHSPASEPLREAVLVVDDERPLLDMFAEALGTRFEVTTATTAREAEFILRKKSFKVVVADHLMPGGNGMSFLVRAREEYPHMQRVLVTGYMKPEMLLRSVNEAALFRYLLKPVAVQELLNVVTEAAKLHDALKSVAASA